jgi:hypothetical protein
METLKIAFVSVLAVLFFSCNGQTQTKKEDGQLSSSKLNSTDTVNRPKINVNVNKRYDDKGRVVQFDSTYSYFYSSPGGLTNLNNDSIFNSFQSFFNKSYPSIFKDQNRDIFFNDSLFKYDFFNDDYFFKRYQLNQKNFEGFYKRMDSLKQDFLQHNYPNGYQKKEKTL